MGLEGKAKRLSSSGFFCAGGGGLGLGGGGLLGGGLLGETSTSSSDEVSNSKESSSSLISMLYDDMVLGCIVCETAEIILTLTTITAKYFLSDVPW